MSLLAKIDPLEGEKEIEPGKRLIRVGDDRGVSLAERLSMRLHRLSWRTPFHAFRLRGRFPLRLLAVPKDPIAGEKEQGVRIASTLRSWLSMKPWPPKPGLTLITRTRSTSSST